MIKKLKDIFNTILLILCNFYIVTLPILGNQKIIVIENYHLALCIMAVYIVLWDKIDKKE